jgi:Protein-glutamine gamma-glutamyltransferase
MPQGCFIQCVDDADALNQLHNAKTQMQTLGIGHWVKMEITSQADQLGLLFVLERETAHQRLPEFNTLALREQFQLVTCSEKEALVREVMLAMLTSPLLLTFPSYAEFLSAQNMRLSIALNAQKTAMAFKTDMVDRPQAYWTYSNDHGFILRPEASLIEALKVTTQPDLSGQLYGFSCYRATEYVILLAIAQEAQNHHPELLSALETQWRQSAVMSGKFHDVFLREYGSNDAPLPDDASSDVPGYEGSWVIYLGNGLFANFWRPDQPYDLVTKCLEIYHWRHGVFTDEHNNLKMDECKVDQLVALSKQDSLGLQKICERMMRLRDPQGIYADGGCMDNTRESPRWVRPNTTDIRLPDAPLGSSFQH